MGIGIGYVAAGAGYQVDLVEVDPERAQAAQRTLQWLWDSAVTRGKLSEADAAASRTRIAIQPDLSEVADGPEVIVEAVPERLELKRTVLVAAESVAPALLASNTSSISIAELAAPLARPERFVGLHFFNPVWKW
jgi:3-hydroxybutyryl-CoA dehydrogenase